MHGRHRKLAFCETPGPARRQFFLFRPVTERVRAPLVVSVHGISRNAAAHVYRFMAEAERYGLVIAAPLFTKEGSGQYQQLEDPKTGFRSDHALLDIADAAARLSGASADKLLLFGFSGGAQFAQRFVLAHPKRVQSAVMAAAGWYTFPLANKRYPYGLDTEAAKLDLKLDVTGAAGVRQHVLVGEYDTERDASLRQTKDIDALQGLNRVERGQRWVEAMAAMNPQAAPSFTIMPGVGHSFSTCVEVGGLPRLVFDIFARDAALQLLPRD